MLKNVPEQVSFAPDVTEPHARQNVIEANQLLHFLILTKDSFFTFLTQCAAAVGL